MWLSEDSLVRMLHDVGFVGTEKVDSSRGILAHGVVRTLPAKLLHVYWFRVVAASTVPLGLLSRTRNGGAVLGLVTP